MRKGKRVLMTAGLVLVLLAVSITDGYSARDGGYDVTADLWAKAVLKPATGDVTLVWQMVGSALTPSGDQVISGYFYADPSAFAYGSQYNPEVFVKIYITAGGWCNIAFNHVTVDNVEVSSAQSYSGGVDNFATITTTSRLAQHEYTGVNIDDTLISSATGQAAASSGGGGYTLSSDLWAKAVLEVSGSPLTLIWKEVGSDTTPSGDRVVSGYFYADPAAFAYGSVFNPEVFVKVYISSNGWANMAFNHVTVDDVTIYSAHQYAGTPDRTESIGLNERLKEHEYTGVSIGGASIVPISGIQSCTNSLGMTFNLIPAGTFTMGSPTDELGRYSSETQHQVTLTQSYYMQTTEVTQGQWRSVMGSNPSYFSSCGDNCPVEYVSWDDIQSFLTVMNQRGEGTYRLPTEAEWEYAARSGSTTAFANGGISVLYCEYDPNLNAMGWYCYNSSETTHPVAQKQANAWGLYDMHGNVWEWCQDWYGSYPTSVVTDPTGPTSGSYRVLRGGSWGNGARGCCSAGRSVSLPDYRGISVGFRLVVLPGH